MPRESQLASLGKLLRSRFGDAGAVLADERRDVGSFDWVCALFDASLGGASLDELRASWVAAAAG